MPRQHALLSASGAERWMNCTPSARLEEQFPDTKSDYAAEGSLAHAIAELKLRKHFLEPMGPRAFNNRLKKFQEDPSYAPEMLKHTDDYLDYIKSIAHSFPGKPYIGIEVKLDFSCFVPEGFGTADCIIIYSNDLHIIDFKYGQGVPVSAEISPQIRLYALGAIENYSMFYDIQTIHMHIFQPRRDDASSEAVMSKDDLINWGEFIVKPLAQKAFKGEGEYNPGEWCRFCRAKAQCRARSNTMTALEAFGNVLPPLLTDEEVGGILTRAQTLKAWVSDLEEYALSTLLAGGEIPGWKAVEGRSVRQFDDIDKAFDILKANGIDEAVLYERKPITLTAVEKLLGKKQFAELLSGHVIKPPGKPTLAPESDKREAITNMPKAEQVFSNKKY